MIFLENFKVMMNFNQNEIRVEHDPVFLTILWKGLEYKLLSIRRPIQPLVYKNNKFLGDVLISIGKMAYTLRT